MSKLAVIGIGGNSIIRDKNHQRVSDQFEAIKETVAHIADIVETGYNVLLTHGNGPQVGFMLRRSEIAYKYEGLHNVPLVSCVADTQGALGYQIQQALGNEYRKRGINREVVSVITQVTVDLQDPHFNQPSKPIGTFYSNAQLPTLKRDHPDWNLVEDAGRGFRRVVPSPRPKDIVEFKVIQSLVSQETTVVAGGGGGIPVVESSPHFFEGIDAVIDKDYTTSLLASKLGAELLIFTTGVENLYLDYHKENSEKLHQITYSELKAYLDQGHFSEGSMLPKVESVIQFFERGGKKAIITRTELLAEALLGKQGTIVLP